MASIRKRTSKDGQRVSYAVLYAHEGKQKSTTFEDEASAKKFKTLVDGLGADAARELNETRKVARRTVSDLFAEWLEHKRPGMTVEAHRDYERAYAKWIQKQLGWRDAELVTERDVQAWVDKTLVPSLGAKAIAKQHALLHGMFKWASSKTVGYIANDPCTETTLPKRKKRPPRGLSVPELHAMLTAAPTIGQQDAADVVAVMAGTGWRPGEVLGLRKVSVEVLANGAVYVTQETVYRRGEGIVLDGKTDAAGRRIRVLGEGAAVLRRRIVGIGFNDPVFPHPSTGKPWSPASFGRHYWPKVVEAAGLTDRGPTPYWLRHTHVALCHAAGMSLPEIQRRIGHESIQTTIDVYGRMIDGMSDESADKLEALLTPIAVVQGELVD
jgi:integrase